MEVDNSSMSITLKNESFRGLEKDDLNGMTTPCAVCLKTNKNDIEYGEILTRTNITVHYFCLLLSKHLLQRGAYDSSGIRRFLLRDIRDLIIKSAKVNCCYCNEPQATVYCQKCNKKFHLICGVKEKCRPIFEKFYECFCIDCTPVFNSENIYYPNKDCYICSEKLEKFVLNRRVPSCIECNLGWFHASCLKKYALHSGYNFTCPLCRNKSYRNWIKQYGIYIPDAEPTWETNEMRCSTQYQFTCDETNQCQCPDGMHTNTNEWPLNICRLCGQFGIHSQCSANKSNVDEPIAYYVCKSCTKLDPILERLKSEINEEKNESVPILYESIVYPIKEDTRETDDCVIVEDVIETITIKSSDYVTTNDNYNYRKMRIEMYLNAPFEYMPIDPWCDNDDDPVAHVDWT